MKPSKRIEEIRKILVKEYKKENPLWWEEETGNEFIVNAVVGYLDEEYGKDLLQANQE